MSNGIIFIGGEKGGTTKSTTAHLICLGAVLRNQPADYVLTDPRRSLKSAGRPYSVLDGRVPANLLKIISASQSVDNGWLVIDGGGNRPAFDKDVSQDADLVLLPFRDSEEDAEVVARGLIDIPHALALPSAWPTNRHAQDSAKLILNGLADAFPGRVIETPIYFVNSVKELLGDTLGNPLTTTRSAARRAFDVMQDTFESKAKKKAAEAATV